MKQKIINENKLKNLLKEKNEIQNQYMITEYNFIKNDDLNTTPKFRKITKNFNYSENKFKNIQSSIFNAKSIKLDNPSKIKLKLKIPSNNTISPYTLKEKLPIVNKTSLSNPKNSLNLNINNDNHKIQSYNHYTNLTSINTNDSDKDDKINKYYKTMTYIKTEANDKVIRNNISNLENYGKKNKIEINDEKKFKYSLILKNLDIWDKDHCEGRIKNSDSYLYQFLNNYYQENNLKEEQKQLNIVSNILKTRRNYNNVVEEGKQNNKIFLEMIKKKQKETGTILNNNLYKAKIKFSELFNKKYSKEFKDNLAIDPDTLNLLIEEQLKNEFYNQIIKERIKYETQLHDELLKVNNIIFDRKNIKEEKILKLKELFLEKTKLKQEYNEKYTKNRKSYWFKYDNYERHYKRLITKSNIKANADLNNKTDENDDNNNTMNIYNYKKNKLSEKNVTKFSSSLSPSRKYRKRMSAIQIKVKEDLKKQIKEIEDERNFKLLHMNNEMNSKLKEMQNNYITKIDRIQKEQKILEEEIKIIKIELEYFRKINDELVREHKLYYINKLKKGYDCRKEGLSWIVSNLLELQIPLEYHHFPKYLTHEQIDYIKKYANLILKQKELKIIINVLKKKQNTQKMNDILKCMDVIDNIEFDNKEEQNLGISGKVDISKDNDFIISKNKINKKFVKLYQENIDIIKNYLIKNIENYEFHHVIIELKKDLYHGSNSDINKSKRNILNIFMGDNKNKNFFQLLINIKSNYQQLEEEKEKLFEIQKQNYLKLVESSQNHKATINNVVKNEMIKRCLFGTKLDR